jgi:hypothetical protein
MRALNVTNLLISGDARQLLTLERLSVGAQQWLVQVTHIFKVISLCPSRSVKDGVNHDDPDSFFPCSTSSLSIGG